MPWSFKDSCCLWEGQRALRFHQKYLNLCSEDERRSSGFGTTWGRTINDIIFIFGWTIPLILHFLAFLIHTLYIVATVMFNNFGENLTCFQCHRLNISLWNCCETCYEQCNIMLLICSHKQVLVSWHWAVFNKPTCAMGGKMIWILLWTRHLKIAAAKCTRISGFAEM